jgi:hypothetical protein
MAKFQHMGEIVTWWRSFVASRSFFAIQVVLRSKV